MDTFLFGAVFLQSLCPPLACREGDWHFYTERLWVRGPLHCVSGERLLSGALSACPTPAMIPFWGLLHGSLQAAGPNCCLSPYALCKFGFFWTLG